MKLTVILVLLAVFAITETNLVRHRPAHAQVKKWTAFGDDHQCNRACVKAGHKICGKRFRECCINADCESSWFGGSKCPQANMKQDLDCSEIHDKNPSRWGGNACDAECKGFYGGVVCQKTVLGQTFKRCCKLGCENGGFFSNVCKEDKAYDIQYCGQLPGDNPPAGTQIRPQLQNQSKE